MQTDTCHVEVVNPARLAALEKRAGLAPLGLSDVDLAEKERQGAPPIVPLDREARAAVDTATAAYHLSRQPQTLRGWACAGTYPPGLRPLRVMGRLAWPVAGIRAVLGVA